MYKFLNQWLTRKEVEKFVGAPEVEAPSAKALKNDSKLTASPEAESGYDLVPPHFQRASLGHKPYTVPVIFLHLAQIYRDQCKGRVAKQYHRRGLRLALEKITTGETKINDALYPPPVTRTGR